MTQDVTPDPAAQAILDKYTTLSAPLANKIIGTITSDILLGARHARAARTPPASSRWAT